MKYAGMQYEEETNWDEVFALWREREGSREEWQQVAKEKGWDTWEEWRGNSASGFGAADREWFRYTIEDPLGAVPQFRVGPTKSWQKKFPEGEKNTYTFADAARLPVFQNNPKVKQILEDFPSPTEFIGVVLADKTIVLFEGHHRATAIALAAARGTDLTFDVLPTIALTLLAPGDETLLDDMLVRGSEKPQ